MDWRDMVKDDLKKYIAQKESLCNIADRIEKLREEQCRVRGSTLSAVPTHGGTSQYEDKLLTCITEIYLLERQLPSLQDKIAQVEIGLSGLSDIERKVLDVFYIKPSSGSVQSLASELGYEQRQVYRIRDNALRQYTIRMFGHCDY